MTLSALGLFTLALLINPGSSCPSIVAIVSRVIASGWRDVLPFIAAMWIGKVIWLFLALAGLSAIAQNFESAFQFLKYCGVAYLLWLAWKMWTQKTDEKPDDMPIHSNRWAMFASGMALTLGNPKIIMFYIALLPTLIDITGASYTDWMILGGFTALCLASVDLTWARACASRPSVVTHTARPAHC
ncbi:MAG: LysE family translocator [Amylibacter sp.]